MTKETLGVISIALEAISFFMVTIDLYGKERLIETRKRIQIKEDDIIAFWDSFEKKYTIKIPFERAMYIVGVIIYWLIIFYIFYLSDSGRQIQIYFGAKPPFPPINITNYPWLYSTPFQLTVLISTCIFIAFFGLFMIKACINLAITIGSLIVELFIWLVKGFPIEGIMLISGTILFIISKIISIINVY